MRDEQLTRLDNRERFHKRLVWLYSITLVGVLLMLIPHIAPDRLGGVQILGIGLTFAGGLLQIVATWDYSQRERRKRR